MQPAPPKPPPPRTAFEAGAQPGPAVSSLAIDQRRAADAFAAFKASCPALLRRRDASGLTRSVDWQPACAAARAPEAPDDPLGFFVRWFETARIGDGRAFATGYYEPDILGSRERGAGYEVPIYRRPPDLVTGDVLDADGRPTGRKMRGRMVDGRVVPYYDRAAIDEGALAGQGLELAWAADPVEFFFLQVQGSGRLVLPDGRAMRIGYDGQNGREYVGIGKLMRDRGLLGPGQTSMQGIMAWLRAHPDEGREIMHVNKSFVFFRELKGIGPVGALGVEVRGRTSVAADPAFVPLGAPVFLTVDRPEAGGLWIAQDTGGAIKGSNRFDTFWGAGTQARITAGGMSARGQALILLPRGTVERIGTGGGAAAQR